MVKGEVMGGGLEFGNASLASGRVVTVPSRTPARQNQERTGTWWGQLHREREASRLEKVRVVVRDTRVALKVVVVIHPPRESAPMADEAMELPFQAVRIN
jgi:hypothetical protein